MLNSPRFSIEFEFRRKSRVKSGKAASSSLVNNPSNLGKRNLGKRNLRIHFRRDRDRVNGIDVIPPVFPPFASIKYANNYVVHER